MTADVLVRMAHARLMGLKESLDQRKAANPTTLATKEFIDDYHDILKDLESLESPKVELKRFRIPDSATQSYEDSMWCDIDFMTSKLGGLLNLFTVSQDKTKIGFLDRA